MDGKGDVSLDGLVPITGACRWRVPIGSTGSKHRSPAAPEKGSGPGAHFNLDLLMGMDLQLGRAEQER